MLQGIGARESKNLWADFSYQAALIDCDLLEIFSSKLVKDFFLHSASGVPIIEENYRQQEQVWSLTLSPLGKIFSRRHIEIF